MKKAICVILILIFLCSCGKAETVGKKSNGEKKIIIGAWISCYELNAMLDTGNLKDEFCGALENLEKINASDVFVHVRAFGDSLFESDFYPQNEKTLFYDFDVLDFMITEAEKRSIRFHAWINPFRAPDGSFLNPADGEVRKRILSGVREIANKYKISGVHFDDYFYPSPEYEGDKQTLTDYANSAQNALTAAEYRTACITSLVFSVKGALKSIDPGLIFSISPAADIEKNKNSFFADVEYWCAYGAADWIIPQLYFGFEYPQKEFGFENLLAAWRSLPRDKGVKLITGLPSYKLCTDKEPDSLEWGNGTDILARQVTKSLSFKDISGVCFFSYSSLFIEDDTHKASLKNIRNAIKKSTPKA